MARFFGVSAALFLVVGGLAMAGGGYPYYANNAWYSQTSGAYTYYYTQYYYAPQRYHFCYYYPYVSQRYVYYYNPVSRRYWGRFDLQSNKYSMLPENARKEKLEDIKETDFPEPQALNQITLPDTELKMTAPPSPPKQKK
jgi:hypothetical protein